MLTLATYLLPLGTAQLDSDPWLLNCDNGVVDLRTGTLRPHARADFITRLCPVTYDPMAVCPLWNTLAPPCSAYL